MKVSSIFVVSVAIKLHNRVIWQDIFNLYMNVSSMLAISENALHSLNDAQGSPPCAPFSW